ncbi:MAG: dihydroneopterin aldolase [Leptolyngbya sp. SIO4C1]|nr:dihydroneopterin aldolase [Leptolyngbya sp. SIO4C1]
MDKIEIAGICAYGYIGALPEENVLGQWFEIDISLSLDLSIAGKSDRLEDTHSYVTLIEQTQQLVATQKFKLIERLADAIAAQALSNDSRIQEVSVKVTKPHAPIPNFSGKIAVAISRKRA